MFVVALGIVYAGREVGIEKAAMLGVGCMMDLQSGDAADLQF